MPIAVIDANVDRKPPSARAAADAFIQYCFTPAAQREFAACGFRCDCGRGQNLEVGCD